MTPSGVSLGGRSHNWGEGGADDRGVRALRALTATAISRDALFGASCAPGSELSLKNKAVRRFD